MGLQISRIRNYSNLTMFVFGAMSFVMGVLGLVRPTMLLDLVGLEQVLGNSPFLITSSVAAVNMGAYYVLASLADLRAFFRWTVPFRLLTFSVFTGGVLLGTAPSGVLKLGLWELAGALLTGAALLVEARKTVDRTL
jgi:hypothetical protein